jgi:formylglycine-generating enzyme
VSRAARGAVLGLALLLDCSPSQKVLPPTGQLLLYLDTDAPLPSSTGAATSALTPAPLFDRVRFDATPTLDGGPCDCSREFDVTDDRVESGSVSFGVLPPLAGHGTLRVRLFRGDATVQGEPDPGSTIDMTFALPAVPAEGIVSRTLFLPTDAVGVPQGTKSPLQTSAGPPNPFHVGTWPGAQRKNCPAAPQEGEVCVPGGAFWMGNVAAANAGPDSGNVSRLVVMSPYYLDATEMTVGAYRAEGGECDVPWSGTTGCDPQDYCTYTSSPGNNDGLPVNCIEWTQARAVCQKQGKDLPTEAQFEYAASGLAGQPYVWGTDIPQCGDVVFERGGYGYFNAYAQECVPMGSDTTCGGAPAGGLGLGGPLPPKSGMRDQLTIALPGWTATIYDLIGNIDELTRDQWNAETDPCWSRPGVYTNPLCSDPTSTEETARGGDWTQGASAALAAQRQETPMNVIGPYLGFRCARSP